MNDDPSANPYLQDELSIAPFSGRREVFSRLHHVLTETPHTAAALVIGRRQMGKSALLRQFDAVFDETFVGVYVDLAEVQLHSEAAWLETLADAISAVLDQRSFGLNRLMERTKEDGDVREWIRDTRLPDVFATIRGHRRLVLLLDDAHWLVEAVEAARLPNDSFSYLRGLLDEHAALGMILTLGAQHEDKLDTLKPLVDTTAAIYLNNLSLEDTAYLLRQPVTGMYNIPDETVTAVHQASGGNPLLVQYFGHWLFERWQNRPTMQTIAPEVVKSLTERIYTENAEEFKEIWLGLSRDERLVLTAISGLLYHDPLRKIDTALLESWLVETEYPTDTTAINAAIRSLEYRELLASGERGVGINGGLLQKWLIENARIDFQAGDSTRQSRGQRILGFALVVIVIAAIVILLVTTANQRQQSAADQSPAPTITLPSRG